MRPFKFFQKEDVIDYDGLLIEVNNDNLRREIELMTSHDNIPQDIVDCGEIGAYNEGINANIHGIINNPYQDQLRAEIWNRGFWVMNNLLQVR